MAGHSEIYPPGGCKKVFSAPYLIPERQWKRPHFLNIFSNRVSGHIEAGGRFVCVIYHPTPPGKRPSSGVIPINRITLCRRAPPRRSCRISPRVRHNSPRLSSGRAASAADSIGVDLSVSNNGAKRAFTARLAVLLRRRRRN